MKTLLILIFFTTTFCTTSVAQCLTVNVTNTTDVNCFGGLDGTATLTPTNGQAPYTYTWSTGTTTVSGAYTITNLPAGAHNITVEDNLGCDRNTTIIISQPSSSLQINTSVSSNYNGADISCSLNCDGEALVTASGGTANYTYLWSQGGTTPSITGLCAGMYYVTVYDANNCFVADSVEITPPSSLTGTIANTVDVNCNGDCTGTATVAGSGGVSLSYTYLWPASAGNQTTATASNLCAGIYCPTVTDANGCEAVVCVTIGEPTVIAGSINLNSAIGCSGAPTGELSVNIAGGTPSIIGGYTYVWSAGGVTTSTISNLPAGNYCVTATDSLGCIWTDCVSVYDSSLTLSVVNTNNASCNGVCDGGFTVAASGGAGPFLYSIDGGITFTNTSTYSNLCAGQYTILAQNADNCTATSMITISAPNVIGVQIVTQDTTCQGSTGNLLGVVTGGTPVYNYVWGHGTTSNPTTYNTAGNYCLTVTDVNGCTATTCTNVDTLNFEVNITNGIISGNQKYGITYSNNPQIIQTASSYPSKTIYNWSPSTGLSCTTCPNPTVSVTTPTQYILNANHNSLGCTSSDTIIIYPYSTDTITLEVAPDSTINYCSNYPPFISGATSTGIGPLSYGSITYGTSGCFDYISNGSVLEGVDTLIWINCATVNIGVLPVNICDTTVIYLTTASCVWPGDTDNDGVTNNFDLLPIGQHHGTTGLTRTNASTNYTCQPALNWGTTILGMPTVDLKHVDTDGNASINSDDTTAITLNWTQTHLKNNNALLTGIDLYVDTITTTPGDTLRVPIILGNTAVPNGYGIAFTVNYDPAGIDTNTVSIDFDNSWLGTINSDMIGIHKDFYYQGQTEVALTRINQTAVTGSGAIAHINFTIKDDVLPKSAFLRLDFDISNIKLIDPFGTIIPVTGVPTQILVTDGLTSTEAVFSEQKNKLTVFPNPTNGQVQIQSLVEEIETISIYNLTGTLLLQKENIQELNATLDLKTLPSGIYIANVISEKGMQSLRIIKK